jgi:adenosylcobinamide kinase/adenosylcobinamide-phosphate guanylyltransferase
MGQLIMILGGVRSGKSSFAEALAKQLGDEDVVYLATAESCDEEMSDRIARHQSSRPSSWTTIESRRELARLIPEIASESEVILLDCLTIWISNILLDAGDATPFVEIERQMRQEISEFIDEIKRSNLTCLVVAGEVGMGVVPESLLGRQFRDLHGWANQTLVDVATQTYWRVAGRTVNLKSISQSLDECVQECQSS